MRSIDPAIKMLGSVKILPLVEEICSSLRSQSMALALARSWWPRASCKKLQEPSIQADAAKL